MKKRVLAAMLAVMMLAATVTGCGKREAQEGQEETEIQVFIAASLNKVMTELAELYNEKHPNVKIVYNADSSGTLMTQIQEGYECDIFFSAFPLPNV